MRVGATPNRPRNSKLKSFAAPTGGWVANRNLATPNIQGEAPGAEVLENFFPTASGAILRRGSSLYATLGSIDADVTATFSYKNGADERLFASTATDIYDITTITAAENSILVDESGDAIVDEFGDTIGELSTDSLDVLSGLTGGDWVVVQFATSGGVFLFGVNGVDDAFLFDGTRFYPIDANDVYTLDYDGGTGGFELGETITGGTSGATAIVAAIDGDEASGTLVVHTITGGPFTDNEALTGGVIGVAVADGVEALAYGDIAGVATSSLSYLWVYQSRVFFVEKNSLDAWYLAVDSVGGTATKFPLGGVFTLGGSLVYGASWSLGEGASGGLSAQCAFVSSEGEVAVYQGNDPSDAATWSLVGVYRIGKPLGNLAHIRAGGDIVIATDIGFVPLSQAIQRDYAALSPSAVSFPIEDAWREATELRSGSAWTCQVWPSKQMVVVALPAINEQRPEWFVANTRTGKWGNFTGWHSHCMEVFQGRLFYGSNDGKVIEAMVTGQDEGSPFVGTYVPLFDDLRTPGSLKIAQMARTVLRSPVSLNEQVSMMTDFEVNLPPAPDAPQIDVSSVWGGAVWGESVWGTAASPITHQNWHSVGGEGYALAPGVQVTSGEITPLDAEIVRTDITYETADIVS